MKRLLWALLPVAILLAGPAAFAGGTFEIIEEAGLDWFPGIAYLSQDGSAMAGKWVTPFYWTEVDGYLPLPLTMVYDIGRISDDGLRVAVTAKGTDGYWAPGTWSPTAGFELMDLVPGAIVNPDYYGTAYDLDSDGSTGTGLTWLSNMYGTAFLWTRGAGSVALAGSGNSTRGTGISGDGSTVVGFDEHPTYGHRRAAIWVDGVGPQLIAGTEAYGECYDATYDGFAVCGVSDLDAGSVSAFYWDREIGYFNLGTLPGYESQGSMALDISDDLKVVGYSGSIRNGLPKAFIWERDTGMTPLADYIASHGVEGYAGEYLYSATGISGDGRVIVGNYLDQATYYWGAFRVVLDEPVAGAPADPDSPPIAPANLLGAHPNPFNPATSVRFSLAREQGVRLSVFDMTGRHVAALADRVFPAGEHSLTWRGRDDKGREVPSGTYVLRLDTDDASTTSKVMLVR